MSVIWACRQEMKAREGYPDCTRPDECAKKETGREGVSPPAPALTINADVGGPRHG